MRRFAFVLIAWLAIAHSATAQSPSREKLLTVARRLMNTARYAGLITLDASGRPQARTVDPFAPDSLMTVWFATNPKTRKVGEIRRDARVTLYYFDASSEGYVTLIGRARLVTDKAEKAKRFKPEWKGFYPDRDSSYVLIEVRPERLEVVSVKDAIQGDAATWKPPAVILKRGY